MAVLSSLWRLMGGSVKEPGPQLLKFSSVGFELLPLDMKVDEEAYDLSRYYPTRIGDIIEDKYQIVGKLGFGMGSTVWLANDFKDKRTVALKLFTNDRQNREEIKIYNHLGTVKSEHPGRHCLRNALACFSFQGPGGEYQCLVHEPMLENTYQLLTRNPTLRLTEELLRLFLQQLLLGLDYLHTEAHLVHTDISNSNILLGLRDPSIFKKYIKAEQKYPSPRKDVQGHTIYASRRFEATSGDNIGPPLLSDFGSAVFGDVEHDEDVQPDVYRAPEVCLKTPWSYSIDIWNLGCLIWDLYENKHMFYGQDPKEKKYMTRAHLSEMVALMGPPPLDLLKRGKRSLEFFDEDGQWRGDIPLPDRTSLEESEENLEGSNKEAFLRFIRKMIQWRPEDRQTARQLLEDEWLQS